MKRFFSVIVLLLSFTLSHATQAAMGQWRTHLSFTSIGQITESGNKIFGLSNGALFSVDKTDFTLELITKLSGLSSSDIKLIKYSPYNEMTIIVYNSSNIDFLSDDNTIVNVSDIYNKSFSGDKTINNVSFHGNMAYLAMGFGVIVVNMDKYEIADTYTIGDNGAEEKFIDIQATDDYIYALGDNTLRYAPISGVNLSNYANWQTITLPEPSVANKQILAVADTLFLVKTNGSMYRYVNSSWSAKTTGISSLSYDDGYLFTSTTANITSAPGLPSVENAISTYYDLDNQAIWYSTTAALCRYDLPSNTVARYAPNGPASNNAWSFTYADGRMFVVPGGKDAVQYNRPGYVSIFENNSWKIQWHQAMAALVPTNTCYDLVSVAVDPNDKTHYFAASYGQGIYEFRNDQLYMLYNSDVPGTVETVWPNGSAYEKYNYQRTDALNYDPDGNLWFYNFSLGNNFLKVITPDGVFHTLIHDEMLAVGVVENILFYKNNSNIKVLDMPRYSSWTTGAVYIFDDRGTLTDASDDRVKVITTIYDQDNKQVSLSQRRIRCVEQDNNGTFWVGTEEGLFLLNDIENAFSDDYRCQRIKIPRNDGTGLADYLLETDQINDIAIDGANRKWIATQNSGVYLVSSDGEKTIHHFTETNSPLLSNNTTSIEINQQTGEVFIGTGLGIISYQSDSNEGGDSYNNVHAFPNPVRPEFDGIITVTGLTDNSSVRFTDVNGNLIYETRSYGGYATWDGCRANGSRVASGIYFAHCLSEDLSDKTIVKIMIINK